MRKVIPFTKTIDFNSMIKEITDIMVTNDLKLNDNNEVVGNIIVDGKYKMTDASNIENDFHYELPFVISIDSKYDTNNLDININDFNFEIINEQDLKVNLDVILDNLELLNDTIEIPINTIEEKVKLEVKDDVSLSNDDIINPILKEEKEINNDNNDYDNNDNNDKSDNNIGYSTYFVYIMQETDTINTIVEKYNISKDELIKYNDLENLTIGSKIIIPCPNE